MGKTKRRAPVSTWKILGGITALLILAAAVVYFGQDTFWLEVINRDRQSLICRQSFAPGQRFSFMYVHSVQKTPVYEVYTVDAGGRVMLLETRVQSLGFGLPDPRPGDNYRLQDGYLVIKDLNRPVDRLLIRINFVRPMELRMDGKSFDLRKFGAGGDLIEVSVKRTKKIRAFTGV